MANKTYPRVGSKQKAKGGQCKICGKQNADLRVDVQFNVFRGDDEVYKVHKSCIDELGDQWASQVLTDYVNMTSVE